MYICPQSCAYCFFSHCSLLIIWQSCCLSSPHLLLLNPKIINFYAKIPRLQDTSGLITKYFVFLTAHKLPLIAHRSLLTAHKIALPPWILEETLAQPCKASHSRLRYTLFFRHIHSAIAQASKYSADPHNTRPDGCIHFNIPQ